MGINDYKYFVSEQLKAYLGTLSYRERVEFVTEVVQKTGIRRSTFFNWKSMACRMPVENSKIIESIAGRSIFSGILTLVPSCHG